MLQTLLVEFFDHLFDKLHMFQSLPDQPYQEPVRPTLTQAQRTRKAQRLTRELRNLGFEVTLKTKAA